MRAQFHGCYEAQLVVVNFNVAHDQTAASAARSYYSNALLCRSRERSDRRIRTVPVANTGQHDALYSLFHQEINYFGAEIFLGVDDLYARQVARSLSVNCKFTLGCVAGRVLRKELDLTYIHHASATAVWGMEGV